MTREPELELRLFAPNDQAEARALILEGLGEHWGHIDPDLNPDLDDIATRYAGATFLVARKKGRLVGTGACVPRSETDVEIVRMSVASDLRRQGIARRVLERLCATARAAGYRRVFLETTSTWRGVIKFYLDCGFRITHEEEGAYGGETYFELFLDPRG